MWICQETKDQEDGHHFGIEMVGKDQQDAFGARKKVIRSLNVQSF